VECLLRCGNRQLPHHLAQGFSGSDLNRVYEPTHARLSLDAAFGTGWDGLAYPLVAEQANSSRTRQNGFPGAGLPSIYMEADPQV